MASDISLNNGEALERRSFPAGPLPLSQVIRAEIPILFLVTLYGLLVLASQLAVGGEIDRIFVLYNEPFVILLSAFTVAFAVGYCVFVMVFIRPEKLTLYLIHDFKSRYLRSDRLLRGVIVIAAILPFMSAFTLFKTSISQLNPFSWDTTFVVLDRLLHGGLHPWEWLQPLLGTPLVTSALNHVYHAWFFVLFGVVFHQAFQCANPVLRMRFFLSFLLTWILLGSLAAVVFSSAGPVFYERLSGDATYQELFAYLYAANEQFPVLALEVQENLWSAYQDGQVEKGAGISAMPSMHVAMAMLFVLLAKSYGRLPYLVAVGFFLLIFLGSVHLGWHYALDGYVAAFLAWGVWKLAGYYSRTYWAERIRVLTSS